ncbi:MAG: CpsB/CapC family capsule biosynthesis tyrosine phosphatase [Clostridia bacterium]
MPRNRNQAARRYRTILTDIHCHVLPGIDDGSPSPEVTKRMFEQAALCGVSKIIATPHARHHVDFRAVRVAYDSVADYAKAYGIELLIGFELRFELLLKLNAKQLQMYCGSSRNNLLIEFRNGPIPPQWEYTLCELIQSGYHVIIAHPERYPFIQSHPEMAAEMRRYGCEMQLDALSYLARPWDTQRKTFLKLLKNGWADYIASDAHKPEDYTNYGIVLQKLQKRNLQEQ